MKTLLDNLVADRDTSPRDWAELLACKDARDIQSLFDAASQVVGKSQCPAGHRLEYGMWESAIGVSLRIGRYLLG